MTVNGVIDSYGCGAERGLSLSVLLAGEGGSVMTLNGTRAAYDFLGHLLQALIDDGECYFSISPFGGGSGYFQSEGPGLYFHLQPCTSNLAFFSEREGLGWVCFTDWFDQVPAAERDYDPSFVMIEGDQSAFGWLSGVLLRLPSQGERLVIKPDEVSRHLGTQGWSVEFRLLELGSSDSER
jgi:hypothetical protein